jgi:hypothetical protein
MHWVVVFIFYNVGLVVNVLGGAFASMQSKVNGIHTVGTYFRLRWIPLTARWCICVFMFLILWENPSLNLGLEKIMPTFGAHVGVAGALGYLSDAVWDRVLGIVAPGIHKTLPPVPDAAPNPPN